MALCADNHQTARSSRLIIKFNIRTTTCHIGRDRHSTMNTCLSHNLRLKLMKLSVEYLMLNPFLLQHSRQLL